MKREYLVTTPPQLGQIARAVRKARGLTQEEMAARVGLRQKAVSLFEGNPGPTSLERLFRMLAALELELVVREKPTGDEPTRLEW